VRNLLFAEAMSDFLSRKNPSGVAALKITAAHVRAPVDSENRIPKRATQIIGTRLTDFSPLAYTH
jgi:hypothetical protein